MEWVVALIWVFVWRASFSLSITHTKKASIVLLYSSFFFFLIFLWILQMLLYHCNMVFLLLFKRHHNQIYTKYFWMSKSVQIDKSKVKYQVKWGKYMSQPINLILCVYTCRTQHWIFHRVELWKEKFFMCVWVCFFFLLSEKWSGSFHDTINNLLYTSGLCYRNVIW